MGGSRLRTQRASNTGLDLGVAEFTFREVFYHPDSPLVDHTRMPGLMLQEGQFDAMRDELAAEFASKTTLVFADGAALSAGTKKMKADSGFE